MSRKATWILFVFTLLFNEFNLGLNIILKHLETAFERWSGIHHHFVHFHFK